MSKRRPGSHAIPRWIYEDIPLTTDERFLLMYFHSHDPEKYEHHVPHICKNLGWGKGKYFKNRQLLVDKQLLVTTNVRAINKKTGKKVVTGLLAKVILSTDNQHLETASKCRISAPSKSIPLSKTTNKGSPPPKYDKNGEVIDLQDEAIDIQF